MYKVLGGEEVINISNLFCTSTWSSSESQGLMHSPKFEGGEEMNLLKYLPGETSMLKLFAFGLQIAALIYKYLTKELLTSPNNFLSIGLPSVSVSSRQ